MGVSVITYALCKKFVKQYVAETAAEFGALKGANCTILSIEKENGQNIVTFEWKNSHDETRTSKMYVNDGTPIYTWMPGDTYKYGDLVIYESAFYRCIQGNSDTVFDPMKWNGIGSPDSNFGIVQNESLLPARFTAADRKMYYCIDEDVYFLWDGEKWEEKSTVPKASSSMLGGVKINQNGLEIDNDGTLSVQSIENEDINDLFDN